jgi:hypothetical protein
VHTAAAELIVGCLTVPPLMVTLVAATGTELLHQLLPVFQLVLVIPDQLPPPLITVTVIALDVAGLPVGQVALLVITQVTTSLFERVVVV